MLSVSATTLKNDTARIVNEVQYNQKEVVIKKHGKAVAKIVPVKDKNSKKKYFEDLLEMSKYMPKISFEEAMADIERGRM